MAKPHLSTSAGSASTSPRSRPTGTPTSLIIPILAQTIASIQSVTPASLTGVLGLDGAKYQFWVQLPNGLLGDLKAKTLEANANKKPAINIHGKLYPVLPSMTKKEDPNDPFDHRIYPWAIKDPDSGILYRFGRKDSAYQHKVPNKSHEGQAPNVVAYVPAKASLAEPDMRVHEQNIYNFVVALTGNGINSWQLERIDIAFDVLGLDVEIPCYLRVAQACKLTTRDGTVFGDAVETYSGRKLTGFDSGRATAMRFNVYDKLFQMEKCKKSDPDYMALLQARWRQPADHVTRFEFQSGDTLWEALTKAKGKQPRTAAAFYSNLPWIMQFVMGDYYIFHDAPFDAGYTTKANVIWWWAEMTKMAQTWNGVLGHFQVKHPGTPPMAAAAGCSMASIKEQIKQVKTMRKFLETYSAKNGFDLSDPKVADLVVDLIFKKRVVPNPQQVAEMVSRMQEDRAAFMDDLTKNLAWALTPSPRPQVAVPNRRQAKS